MGFSILGIFLSFLIIAIALAGVVLLLVFGIRLIVSVGSRIFRFVAGQIGDAVILLVSFFGIFVAAPLAVFFLVLGKWESANLQARSFGDRIARVVHSLGSMALVRPLRLIYLDAPADAVSEALPGYMPDGAGILETAQAREKKTDVTKPSVTGSIKTVTDDPDHFPGFELVGALRAGGSGARLFIAKPTKQRRAKLEGSPEQVVIKAFALEQGSTLPSIIRESRALEGARRMGLVLEHHLDSKRFWYVMPYHAGESLGVVVNQLHRKAASHGLRDEALGESISYVRDLLQTLTRFHDAGLWHKDVKPDNLIVHDGSAHLVDLGLVTSLQSPLTLTTHGTEYFRDPELVRMALRGVKVHEVDGAKFDVYGVGAVLYFALENDFPAHGGLSDFTRPVPDALRWIVRRAMADYDKRYDSAAAMLADLDTVAAAKDPWSVLPADLPSLKEEAVTVGAVPPPPPPFVRTRSARMVRSARMPLPPRAQRAQKPKPVRTRKTVPQDRPSALLLLLGFITTAAIVAVVYAILQTGRPIKSIDAHEYTFRALGPGATTMTLASSDGQYRVLLVRDEAAHLQSTELRQAMEKVVEWYVDSGYTVDSTPDFDTLAELAIESKNDLTAETDPGVGAVLGEHGYTSLCRVMVDSDGDGFPELRQLHSSGNLSIIPVDININEKGETHPTDAARSVQPYNFGDEADSLVFWSGTSLLESTEWERLNILGHDSERSWRKRSLRRPVPSMRSLHARSQRLALMPPTFPAVHARTSRVTPTLA